MKKVIYKYKLDTTDWQNIDLPKNSDILCVQIQNDLLYLWALINPNTKIKEVNRIRIIGTGQPISDEVIGRYIGTYQIPKYNLVYHVFVL